MRGERQFGQWDGVIRSLSAYNIELFDAYLQWPLRDVLLAYEAQLRDRAREDYHLALLLYALSAPYSSKIKEPSLPAILKDS